MRIVWSEHPPPQIKLVICCLTYWERMINPPLHCLKYHLCLQHNSSDWQLQLPGGNCWQKPERLWWCRIARWCWRYSISNLWLTVSPPAGVNGVCVTQTAATEFPLKIGLRKNRSQLLVMVAICQLKISMKMCRWFINERDRSLDIQTIRPGSVSAEFFKWLISRFTFRFLKMSWFIFFVLCFRNTSDHLMDSLLNVQPKTDEMNSTHHPNQDKACLDRGWTKEREKICRWISFNSLM